MAKSQTNPNKTHFPYIVLMIIGFCISTFFIIIFAYFYITFFGSLTPITTKLPDPVLEKDKKMVENVASVIGLLPDDMIAIDRRYENDFETSTDILYFKYSTNLSVDDFRKNILKAPNLNHDDFGNPAYDIPASDCHILGNEIQSGFVKIALGNILYETNDLQKGRMALMKTDGTTTDYAPGICPRILKWIGTVQLLNNRHLGVDFITPNDIGDKWNVNGKTVKLNLVILTLDRNHS